MRVLLSLVAAWVVSGVFGIEVAPLKVQVPAPFKGTEDLCYLLLEAYGGELKNISAQKLDWFILGETFDPVYQPQNRHVARVARSAIQSRANALLDVSDLLLGGQFFQRFQETPYRNVSRFEFGVRHPDSPVEYRASFGRSPSPNVKVAKSGYGYSPVLDNSDPWIWEITDRLILEPDLRSAMPHDDNVFQVSRGRIPNPLLSRLLTFDLGKESLAFPYDVRGRQWLDPETDIFGTGFAFEEPELFVVKERHSYYTLGFLVVQDYSFFSHRTDPTDLFKNHFRGGAERKTVETERRYRYVARFDSEGNRLSDLRWRYPAFPLGEPIEKFAREETFQVWNGRLVFRNEREQSSSEMVPAYPQEPSKPREMDAQVLGRFRNAENNAASAWTGQVEMGATIAYAPEIWLRELKSWNAGVAFSNNGNFLFVGNPIPRIIDLSSGKIVQTFEPFGAKVTSAVFVGTWLCVGTSGGVVIVLDAKTGRVQYSGTVGVERHQPRAPIHRLIPFGPSSLLVELGRTSGRDERVELFNYVTQATQDLMPHVWRSWVMPWSDERGHDLVPAEALSLAGVRNGRIYLWNPWQGVFQIRPSDATWRSSYLRSHSRMTSSATRLTSHRPLSPSGDHFVAVQIDPDGDASRPTGEWILGTFHGDEVREIPLGIRAPETEPSLAVSDVFSSDHAKEYWQGKSVFASLQDFAVIVSVIGSDGRVVGRTQVPIFGVTAVAVARNEPLIAVADDEGRVSIFSLDDDHRRILLRELPARLRNIERLFFSGNGLALHAVDSAGAIYTTHTRNETVRIKD